MYVWIYILYTVFNVSEYEVKDRHVYTSKSGVENTNMQINLFSQIGAGGLSPVIMLTYLKWSFYRHSHLAFHRTRLTHFAQS